MGLAKREISKNLYEVHPANESSATAVCSVHCLWRATVSCWTELPPSWIAGYLGSFRFIGKWRQIFVQIWCRRNGAYIIFRTISYLTHSNNHVDCKKHSIEFFFTFFGLHLCTVLLRSCLILEGNILLGNSRISGSMFWFNQVRAAMSPSRKSAT